METGFKTFSLLNLNLEKWNAESVEHFSQFILDGFWNELGKSLDPGLDNQIPVHAQWVHVQDSTPGDCGRGS